MNKRLFPLALLLFLALACSFGGEPSAPSNPATPTPIQPSPTTEVSDGAAHSVDKWSLWIDGPHLRGANVYQRRVYPELDGTEFLGSGLIGPPYTQDDLDRLSALGANYVNISHPGIFSENLPFEPDLVVQENLDRLLEMAARADLFAVISFRTGPGRAEFTFVLEDLGDWFDESYLNDAIWEDSAAQDGWVAMWRYTAARYRESPIVVGYDLMVEPNANEVGMEIWDPAEFYRDYVGSLADWNHLFPRITAAIREVDADTPVLVGGLGYSAVAWLPYLKPSGDSLTVYTVHQYEPYAYTHQAPGFLGSFEHSYPGKMDLDWDGEIDSLNRAWLDRQLSPLDDYVAAHGAPLTVNEFGPMRWQPGAADFMRDQMDLFEERGMNHALWVWDPAWEAWAEEVNAFNFRHGPDPSEHDDVATSDLIDVIVEYWGRNRTRPSGR